MLHTYKYMYGIYFSSESLTKYIKIIFCMCACVWLWLTTAHTRNNGICFFILFDIFSAFIFFNFFSLARSFARFFSFAFISCFSARRVAWFSLIYHQLLLIELIFRLVLYISLATFVSIYPCIAQLCVYWEWVSECVRRKFVMKVKDLSVLHWTVKCKRLSHIDG